MKPVVPAAGAWGRWTGQPCLGHQSLIWLSQNKPGQPKETFANYYPLKFSKSVKGHLAKAGQPADLRDGKKQLRSAGQTFPWPWLTAHSDGYQHLLLPSPHLDRQKVDPSLKHSDGQNCCDWEFATPHQSKTQQNPRDNICLKILTPPHFFFTHPFQEIVACGA